MKIDTERLRLNRDGYLEPWPDGMLCYYAHFQKVERALAECLNWMEQLRASTDAGFWDWQEGDTYSNGMALFQNENDPET